MAISSPLLEDVSIDGATGILINITGGPDLTLHEVNEASSLIQQAAHEDANIIFGSVIDANLSDEVRITVIATGFDPASKVRAVGDGTPGTSSGRSKAQQITLPYDASTQITKEYPPPAPPRLPATPKTTQSRGGGSRDPLRMGAGRHRRGQRGRASTRRPVIAGSRRRGVEQARDRLWPRGARWLTARSPGPQARAIAAEHEGRARR